MVSQFGFLPNALCMGEQEMDDVMNNMSFEDLSNICDKNSN